MVMGRRTVPVALAMVTLPRLIGMKAAMHLILTGHPISANEAHRLGIVTRIVADQELSTAVETLLGELRTLSLSVLHLTRKTLTRLYSADFLRELEEMERVYLSELMQTHDAQEGVMVVGGEHRYVGLPAVDRPCVAHNARGAESQRARADRDV